MFIPGPGSGKEIDWDTRGKMLYATQIMTTTEITDIPDNSTLDFEEDEDIDNITEIIELIASSPASIKMSSSSTPMPRFIKISSPQKIQIGKNRKGKHKANTTKRFVQKNRLRRYMENKKSLRNSHKRNGTKFGKNHTIVEKLKRYNTHITSLEKNNTKDNQLVNMVLDQDEENYSIQNKKGPQIKENQKSVKRKRENTGIPLRPKDNYLNNNLWETPTCEIIGDGVDHVCVQYSKPFTANSYQKLDIHPTNYGELNEVKTIDHLETTNNEREKLTDRDSEPRMKQYNMKMYDSIKPPRIHINNFMNRHAQVSKTDDPFDVFKKPDIVSKNPELLEDKIYTEYSGAEIPTPRDILLDNRNTPFKPIYNNNGFRNTSDYMIKYKTPSAKIMHCKKNAHQLPMNITIAMKHLLKHYNSTDLNISNSSYLTPDGTLKFSIELRKGSGKNV